MIFKLIFCYIVYENQALYDYLPTTTTDRWSRAEAKGGEVGIRGEVPQYSLRKFVIWKIIKNIK